MKRVIFSYVCVSLVVVISTTESISSLILLLPVSLMQYYVYISKLLLILSILLMLFPVYASANMSIKRKNILPLYIGFGIIISFPNHLFL
jgi:hypothetical protein